MNIINIIEDGNQIIGKDLIYKNTPEILLVRVINYDYKINKD
jgi:hypothetical protein